MASTCKLGKEGKGCALPVNTSYQLNVSDTNGLNLEAFKRKVRLTIHSGCAQGSKRLIVNGRAKVGKTYKFNDTKVVRTPHGDGREIVTTFKIAVTVAIKSAKKAVSKGKATINAPALPRTDNDSGEDAYNSSCSLNGTLKRVENF